MQYRFVRAFESDPKKIHWLLFDYYTLHFIIDFSLHFTQLPAQLTFSQDSELAVFAQKLKSDLVLCKLQIGTYFYSKKKA